jgi:hypothetical protein
MMAAASGEGLIRSVLGNPGVGRGMSLLVQRSAILLLDTQITEEGAQQLALK